MAVICVIPYVPSYSTDSSGRELRCLLAYLPAGPVEFMLWHIMRCDNPYIRSKEKLGERLGLLAGAALKQCGPRK